MLGQPAQIGKRLLRFDQVSEVAGEHRAKKLTARRVAYDLFLPQKQNAARLLTERH